MKKETVAIIPARGGSRSIPNKNIREFAGKSLIYWTAKAANDADIIDRVFIPTDSPEIKKTVAGFKLKKVSAVERSRESATDNASSEMVLLEVAEKYDFKDLVFLQATSPFVTSSDIENAYRIYKKEKYDSLFSGVLQKRFLWDIKNGKAVPLNYDYKNRPRRQDFKGFFVENGALFITSKINLIKNKNRLSGSIGIYPMQVSSYFELDEPEDWGIAEAIFCETIKTLP